MAVDFDMINRAALAAFDSLVREWLPDGSQSGNEWVARNPRRNDRTAGSFKINLRTGVWQDFATADFGKDPVSLFAYLFHNDEQGPAAKELAAKLGIANDNAPVPMRRATPAPANDDKPAAPKGDDVPPIEVVPDDAPEPPKSFPKKHDDKPYRAPIIARCAYHNADGQVIGYACRIQPSVPDDPNSKDVVICRWIDGKWRFKSFPKPRPVYNLHLLGQRPTANVCIVEGEQKADSAQRLLPGLICIGWPGGAKSIRHVDWSVLQGRKVVIWPDADAEGAAAAEGYFNKAGKFVPGIAQQLVGIASAVKVIDVPQGVKEGWDLKDAEAEGWTPDQTWEYLRGNTRKARSPKPATEANDDAAQAPAEAPASGEKPKQGDDEPAGIEFDSDKFPFRMLGHDGEKYYYLDREGLRVRAIPAASHTKGNLRMLAPDQWWFVQWPGKDGADYDMAANYLMRKQHAVGIYDPSRLRGRGAWYDAGRSVLHMGSHLLVDGSKVSIHEFATEHIYESGIRADITDGQSPLASDRLRELLKFARMLSWDRPVYADMLIGWCVAAVISGALSWRPHVWVTGPSGSGKTWIYEHILKSLVGDWALTAQSSTTEAGIRQALGRDARPVLFEEAEAEDRSARDRMQHVLELMRQASSETGAPILKGSKDGRAQVYAIRSCFAFCSVNVIAQQTADVSRITILQLHKNTAHDAAAQFDRIKRTWAELMTPEFCAGFRATAVSRIPTIRAVQEVFARAASEKFGNRRDGDQYGSLLACAWAIINPTGATVTLDDARAIIAKYDWSEEAGTKVEDFDEQRCITEILMANLRVEIPPTTTSSATAVTRTIAELVAIAAGNVSPDELPGLTDRIANAHLRRIGLAYHEDLLHIADSHPFLRRILADTPWSGGWHKILSRLPGAQVKTAFRFAGNVKRCVALNVDGMVEIVRAAPAQSRPVYDPDDDRAF